MDRVNCGCEQGRDIEASMSLHNCEKDPLLSITTSVAMVHLLVHITDSNCLEGLEEEWWFNPLWGETLFDECWNQIHKIVAV